MEFVPKVQEVKPLVDSLEELDDVDELNQLLLQVGTYLVQDKSNLSKWIQGIQSSFAEFYIASKRLVRTTHELEILKEFLAIKID